MRLNDEITYLIHFGWLDQPAETIWFTMKKLKNIIDFLFLKPADDIPSGEAGSFMCMVMLFNLVGCICFGFMIGARNECAAAGLASCVYLLLITMFIGLIVLICSSLITDTDKIYTNIICTAVLCTQVFAWTFMDINCLDERHNERSHKVSLFVAMPGSRKLEKHQAISREYARLIKEEESKR